jgi:hypothetical protein
VLKRRLNDKAQYRSPRISENVPDFFGIRRMAGKGGLSQHGKAFVTEPQGIFGSGDDSVAAIPQMFGVVFYIHAASLMACVGGLD